MSDGSSSSNAKVGHKVNGISPADEQAGEGSVNSVRSDDRGLDSMFDRLEIAEEEFDDLVLGDEEVDLVESTRWLAVARVHYAKKISHEALIQQMHYAWNSARPITMRPVGSTDLLSSAHVWEIGRR